MSNASLTSAVSATAAPAASTVSAAGRVTATRAGGPGWTVTWMLTSCWSTRALSVATPARRPWIAGPLKIARTSPSSRVRDTPSFVTTFPSTSVQRTVTGTESPAVTAVSAEGVTNTTVAAVPGTVRTSTESASAPARATR